MAMPRDALSKDGHTSRAGCQFCGRRHVSYSYHDARPMLAALMRHLHVISSLNPEGGGPAEGVLRLAEASLGQGHEVEIATLDAPEAPWLRGLPCAVHALGPTRLGAYC